MLELELQTTHDQNTGLYNCQGTWNGNLFTGNGLTKEKAEMATYRAFGEWIAKTYPDLSDEPV